VRSAVLVDGKATRLGLEAANRSTWVGSALENSGSNASGKGIGDSTNPGRGWISSGGAEGKNRGRLDRLSSAWATASETAWKTADSAWNRTSRFWGCTFTSTC